MMALQAKAISGQSGLDPVEALKLLKEQQKQAQMNQMINPPLGCLTGPLPGAEEGELMNGMIPPIGTPGQAMGLTAGIDMNQMSITEEQAQ